MTLPNKVRIATRKSPLALWQAEEVARQLGELYPQLKVSLVQMKTRGDKLLDAPLAKVGGKGLFVKELEVGMLEGRADIAVHSMKDVPVNFPEGLELGLIMEREDPRDAFVSNRYDSLADMPAGTLVGKRVYGWPKRAGTGGRRSARGDRVDRRSSRSKHHVARQRSCRLNVRSGYQNRGLDARRCRRHHGLHHHDRHIRSDQQCRFGRGDRADARFLLGYGTQCSALA